MRRVGLKIFLAVFVLLLLGCGYIYFFCGLEEVEVRGASFYTDAQIRDMVVTSEIDKFAPVLYVKGLVKTIDVPFIEKIEIELTGRNSVRIDVYEKVITACVEKMGQYFYFDNDGTVVETLPERSDLKPLVTGLDFESTVLGERLDIANDSVFDTILDITMLLKKNELEVKTIEFSDNYEINLYTDDDIVRIGKHDKYDLILNNLPGILEASSDKSLIIDMRNYDEEHLDVYAKPRE